MTTGTDTYVHTRTGSVPSAEVRKTAGAIVGMTEKTSVVTTIRRKPPPCPRSECHAKGTWAELLEMDDLSVMGGGGGWVCHEAERADVWGCTVST